ncbi:Monopolin complex subunit MAM1 [Nakaseomyces bracarensis]|uniref:Monopolin complex subunit MAM1 n=1 Tax=Nakaseomyces bracarensis TaxID=273131 RepID=A0ABR4P0D9_9SACH
MVLKEKAVNIHGAKRGIYGTKDIEETETEHTLNKHNLKILQQEIFKFETETSDCPHFLCGHENVSMLRTSRLWFLFELEMSYDGYLNLRNSCYFSRVYQKIIPSWTVVSCLSSKYANKDHRSPDEPISHMLISNYAAAIPSSGKYNRVEEGGEISLEIESLFQDNISAHYIPPTFLNKRRKLVNFTEYKLDVSHIIKEEDASHHDSKLEGQ